MRVALPLTPWWRETYGSLTRLHERYREEIEDVGAVATTAYFPPGSQFDRNGVRPLTRPKGNLEALRLFGRRFISRVQGTGREFHNLPS